MTIAARDGRTLSVGRVKTPTLWLVVKRCREIEAFAPRTYYELAVDVRTERGALLTLRRPSGDAARIWQRSAAAALATAIRGARTVLQVQRYAEQEMPPLPYRLRDFQIDANREYRWKAVQALEVLQKLYEGGLVTYPRTDIAHLREEDAPRVPHLLSAIEAGGLVPECALFRATPGAPVISKPVFNSARVKEHHGMVTTDQAARRLHGADDRIAYVMVARRFLSALMPPRCYERTVVQASLARVLFEAVGLHTTQPGWRLVKPLSEPEPALPPVRDRERAEVIALRIEQKSTAAPDHYTEASLLVDMNGIHKYVDDAVLKTRLKQTSGIGTPATQASTIAELQANGYIEAQGAFLLATQLGRDLIANAPPLLCNPAYTALMEEALQHVEEQRTDLAAFAASAAQLTERLVDDIRARQGRMRFAAAIAEGARERRNGRTHARHATA